MRISIVFLIVLLSTAGMVSQNDPGGTVDLGKINNSPLSLDVSVFDPHGRAVTNLKRTDFALLEDGIPQKISGFTPADTPYNILFLFDCREGTRDRLSLLTEALTPFA